MNPWAATAAGPPTVFVVDDVEYEVDPAGWYDAAEVLAGFEDETWPFALLGRVMETDSWRDLFQRAMDPRDLLDLPDLRAIATALVDATFARPYFEVGRLVGFAVAEWGRLDGILLLRGVDLAGLMVEEPARVPSVLYALLAENKDERDRFKLDAQLSRPPAGAAATYSAWGADAEGSSFMAAFAEHGAGRG